MESDFLLYYPFIEHSTNFVFDNYFLYFKVIYYNNSIIFIIFIIIIIIKLYFNFVIISINKFIKATILIILNFHIIN